MKQIWQFTISDAIEIMERAKANGKKPGDSMEEELREYAREKGIEPIGNTELTTDELLKDAKAKGRNPISIEHDANGKETIKYIKKDPQTEE